MSHISVLKKEVIDYLNVGENKNFIDATAGLGGHSFEILKNNGPAGKVLAIEINRNLYLNLKKKRLARLIVVNDSYLNLKKIVEELNFGKPDGILFDLGLSSWHLEKSGKGFSFKRNEPLDMRYGSEVKNYLTAEKIVNEYSEKEIQKILKEYGEEKFAGKIAKRIVQERRARPIKTTFQLVKIIKKSTPKRYQLGRIHFATRTFQALRIAVNNELEALKKVLPQSVDILKKEGRIVIISFHSLEDKIVKNFFKKSGNLKVLTKKPLKPSDKEIKINKRARSAKLRAAQKI